MADYITQIRLKADARQSSETGTSAFSSDDGSIVAIGVGKGTHCINRSLFVDRHERVGAALENAPSHPRWFITLQHSHYGGLAMRNLDRATRLCAQQHAGRAFWFDYDEFRTSVPKHGRKMSRDGRCECADASLDENVGRRGPYRRE